MMKRMMLFVLPVMDLLLIALPGLSAVAQSRSTESCENLKNLRLPQTTILVAESREAGQSFVPPYTTASITPAGNFCRVMGVVEPEVRFEVWLPAAERWNGRFYGIASGGGLSGSINYRALDSGLNLNYAVANTDAGHLGGNGAYAMGRPELLLDWASRGTHVMTQAAKWIIEAYYGQPPKYSYLNGCSGGGGLGLQEVQRYPMDYNGVVAGAPANYRTHMLPAEQWVAWVNTVRNPAGTIPREKLQLIHTAVLAACDLDDGVKDGILRDPRTCKFDPASIQCKGSDAIDCLTAAQISTLKTIYAGMRDPTTGIQFWPPYMMGSESLWYPHHYNVARGSLAYFKYFYFGDMTWDWRAFDFSDPKTFQVVYDAEAKLRPVLNANDPDIGNFKSTGGKLILYHGWADPSIPPGNTINYYESVVAAQGGVANTHDFMRLFMVPGIGHCSGGDGAVPEMTDLLAAISNWVEKDEAPTSIPASHRTAGKVDMTRPLCVYPKVETYKGSGDINNAANFVCADPVTAKK